MKKKLLSALIATICVIGFAGCGQGQEAPATEAPAAQPEQEAAETPEAAPDPEEAAPDQGEADYRVMVMGLDDTFAPMGFRDEAGNLVGFDIDLANAVGEAMGMEIKFQPISWDTKEMELEAKTIDCVWNGMSRTPEREAMWTLSQNYLNNKIIIMTTPDVTITDLAQLADYQIGTQAKSSALEVVQAHEIFPTIEANLHEYATYDEVILDMQAGRVQVMLVDEVLGQYKNNNLDTKLLVSDLDFGDDFYCIGFRKSDAALCAKIENGLKEVIASGKAAEISEKWFGEDLLLEIK